VHRVTWAAGVDRRGEDEPSEGYGRFVPLRSGREFRFVVS
jgi:hypothetical protein